MDLNQFADPEFAALALSFARRQAKRYETTLTQVAEIGAGLFATFDNQKEAILWINLESWKVDPGIARVMEDMQATEMKEKNIFSMDCIACYPPLTSVEDMQKFASAFTTTRACHVHVHAQPIIQPC